MYRMEQRIYKINTETMILMTALINSNKTMNSLNNHTSKDRINMTQIHTERMILNVIYKLIWD